MSPGLKVGNMLNPNAGSSTEFPDCRTAFTSSISLDEVFSIEYDSTTNELIFYYGLYKITKYCRKRWEWCSCFRKSDIEERMGSFGKSFLKYTFTKDFLWFWTFFRMTVRISPPWFHPSTPFHFTSGPFHSKKSAFTLLIFYKQSTWSNLTKIHSFRIFDRLIN